jgi:hypothetical protein
MNVHVMTQAFGFRTSDAVPRPAMFENRQTAALIDYTFA